MSGLAVGEYGILDTSFGDRLSESIGVSPMSSSIGEWCAVAEDRKGKTTRFLIFGDAYGYAPIFYALIPNLGLVVSTSFNGVAGKLTEAGVSLQLNIDNYVATLATWRGQFATPRPEMTMAKEIALLPLDKAIVVEGSRVFLVSRAELSGIDSSLTYEEVLLRGNDFLKTVVAKIGGVEENQKGLLLSGGVDSRLVLSLIIAANMEKSFKVRTSDPRDYANVYTRKVYERDAQLANEIRHSYGMTWLGKGDVHSVPVNFREALMMHQEYGSNFSYTFRPTRKQSMHKAPVITLRGGGGEILRSTTTGANISAAVAKDRNLDESSVEEKITAWYMENAVLNSCFEERIRDFVQQGMVRLRGDTVIERLNSYYLHTRNRSHFGHARMSRSQNEIPFQLLSNIFYLEASKRIPFDEKANGKMVADIFRQTTPALLDFPFESPVWDAKLASTQASKRKIDSGSWINEFDELKRQRAKVSSSLLWSQMERGEGAAVTDEIASAYLRSAFQLIEDSADEDLKEFHLQISAGLRKEELKIGPLISKVASAVDVFFPSVPLGTTVTLETAPTSTIHVFTASSILPPSVVQDGWNNCSISEFEPRILFLDGAIEIDARPTMNADAGLTYAFYLYRDGERIESSWYGSDIRFVFTTEIKPGSYHGRVFVKTPRASKPLLIRNTEMLVVGR